MRFARVFAVLLSFAFAQVLAADETPAAARHQQLVLEGFKLDASVLPKSFIKRSVELAKEKLKISKANSKITDEI